MTLIHLRTDSYRLACHRATIDYIGIEHEISVGRVHIPHADMNGPTGMMQSRARFGVFMQAALAAAAATALSNIYGTTKHN